MEYIKKIKKVLCKELESYKDITEINRTALEEIWKLTDTIKNLDKIKMLEEGGSHDSYGSYCGGSYDGSYEGGSYRRGRGPGAKRDSMGRYSRDEYPEDGYSERYSERMSHRMSHDQAKDHMMQKLGEMSRVATGEQKQILEDCMRDLDRASE